MNAWALIIAGGLVLPVEYEYLYYFSGGASALVEAKITNLVTDATPDRVYNWLYIAGAEVQKLQFKGMDERCGRHCREFTQGELSFDDTEATLTLSDTAIVLVAADPRAVPADLDASVRVCLEQWV